MCSITYQVQSDHANPLCTEEEGTEVFDYLFRPESERCVKESP
jgi:hypothetical protein